MLHKVICFWMITALTMSTTLLIKVFEYFASDRSSEGEVLMKPADLMRAVVPVFPPSESHLVRDGYLEGERRPGHLCCPSSEFFMLFDVNNDGLISFKEWVISFVLMLCSLSSIFFIFFGDCGGRVYYYCVCSFRMFGFTKRVVFTFFVQRFEKMKQSKNEVMIL